MVFSEHPMILRRKSTLFRKAALPKWKRETPIYAGNYWHSELTFVWVCLNEYMYIGESTYTPSIYGYIPAHLKPTGGHCIPQKGETNPALVRSSKPYGSTKQVNFVKCSSFILTFYRYRSQFVFLLPTPLFCNFFNTNKYAGETCVYVGARGYVFVLNLPNSPFPS